MITASRCVCSCVVYECVHCVHVCVCVRACAHVQCVCVENNSKSLASIYHALTALVCHTHARR